MGYLFTYLQAFVQAFGEAREHHAHLLPDGDVCLARFEENAALLDEFGHGLEVDFEPAAFFQLFFLQAGRGAS